MNPSKILVVYYSRAGQNYVSGTIRSLTVGNTETAAKKAALLAGAEVFSIETVKPYPADYNETTKVAQDELRRMARPQLVGAVANLADYGVVVLGYPNWWGTMPMAVYTFLESYDWAGKTILPFCTHEGSGLGRSEAEVRRVCPRATVLPGLALKGSDVGRSDEALRRWLAGAGVL